MLAKTCIPNDVTFNYLVNGFTNGDPNEISLHRGKSLFLESFSVMASNGWSQTAATYNSMLICLCQSGKVKIAFQLWDKMTNKGFSLEPVFFAVLLYGICLEGRSNTWRKILSSSNFDEQELQNALKYLDVMKKYLYQGVISEVSLILQTLIDDCRSQNLKVSESVE